MVTTSECPRLRHRLEAHHKVKITEAAISAATKLSDRYAARTYLFDLAAAAVAQHRGDRSPYTPGTGRGERRQAIRQREGTRRETGVSVHRAAVSEAVRAQTQESNMSGQEEERSARTMDVCSAPSQPVGSFEKEVRE
ncbi:hypothetical protein [Paraburkholderia xenovorans]|uniref:hypothetical protein n=1 Tax=Paraburkholderia xenovorans TaxID=36873 RepID=UPI0038B8E5D0